MDSRIFYVYFIANKVNTVLYIGLTNDLGRRVREHKDGFIKGFSQKYQVKKLIYYDEYNYIYDAISHEKQLKC